MTKQGKSSAVEALKEEFSNTNVFYVTDSSTLTVAAVNDLRRICFKNDVTLKVAKNTLVKKALDSLDGDYEELYPVLAGPTALMFSEVANAPAKIIKEFRKKYDKPVLKAAFIDSSVYIGDDQVDSLAALKSKEELIADVLGLLEAPMQNLLSSLNSASGNLAGVLKTLAERES